MILVKKPKRTFPIPIAMEENASFAVYVFMFLFVVKYNSTNMERIKKGIANSMMGGNSGTACYL